MIVAIIWFFICLGMGIQAKSVGLALGFWLFTVIFVGLSMGGSNDKPQYYGTQDIYYRNLRKKRKEKEDKKGTIEIIEKEC